MEGFKEFLSDTAGIHLLNFWLDCEYFKDAMENFDEIVNMDIRNRLFRWVRWSLIVIDKWYRLLKKKLIPIIYPDIYGKQKVFKENEEKLHIFLYYYNFVLKYYTKEWVQVYFWNKSQDKILFWTCRDIQDKYKLNLTEEARDQITKASCNSSLSHTVFIRTQYDVLRRLRAYWVPRYLIHMERLRELRSVSNSLQIKNMITWRIMNVLTDYSGILHCSVHMIYSVF